MLNVLSDCEGKLCHNGGALNTKTCTCECVKQWDDKKDCSTINQAWKTGITVSFWTVFLYNDVAYFVSVSVQ